MSEAALARLLAWLEAQDYAFVTPTPLTHHRVLARPDMAQARDLRGAFGWSLPFDPALLPADLTGELAADGILVVEAGLYRSTVRVSSLDGRLFLHSAFPTDAPDSVFFGPDTYRFVRFIKAALSNCAPARHMVDLGAGSGAGGICAAGLNRPGRLTFLDINDKALAFAGINAAAAGIAASLVQGETMDAVDGEIDLILANPPYIADDEGGRAYRHGGGDRGAELSLRWALEGARRLVPGGRMILYTGSAIVSGEDWLRQRLEAELRPLGCTLAYEEIDPDVFGEELERDAYAEVERIAAIGAIIDKAG